MKTMSSFSLILVVAGFSATALQAEQLRWPSWRGAADAGSAAKGTYPAKLDDDHLLWQADLPGRGCSTPIVWDDLIILTAAKGEEDGVLAYDWKGKKVWDVTLGKRRKGKHRNGSSSNSSAVTDGEFVFVYFKSGNLGALNLEGKVLWKHNLQQRYGRDTLYWDIGTSPVITREHVVVAVMNDRKGFLVAYDKATGEEAWKVDRTYETPVEGDHSYATPHVIEEGGRQVLVVWGAERVTTHEAKSGKLISECAGFNPQKRNNWVVVSSSVIVDDMVVVPYGRGKCLAGVKLGGKGEVTGTHRVWERLDNKGCFVPTPAVHDGKVYILGDRGRVHCLDPKTGETLWEGKLPRGAQSYYSSPTIADGKIYAGREDGKLLVAELNKELKVLFERDFEKRIVASPVPVGDRILLRNDTHLMCFTKK
ncbi:MAG: PQQ-binding-like beta-propeller repeat protein [Roseibacillus sp.]|jgi:outer membrane protein assembly factor BamB|nr:PQQ-binding-like beta-propeller repeat protein [Roseibacillus sp.]|tara:strand:- start:3526 stop:4791 length:1266 start_codon:yes stop_codon:yes gene_type:complete